MAVDSTSRSDPPSLLSDGVWRVDPSRSRVGFRVRKLGAGTVRGSFGGARGELRAEGGRATASGAVAVAELDSGSADRDEHLCGPGFFAAETYPEIAFSSREIAPCEDGLRILGELTIRDRSREVELIATAAERPARRLRVRGEIDRHDFGLTWNRAIEATGVVASTVRIELELALVRADQGDESGEPVSSRTPPA